MKNSIIKLEAMVEERKSMSEKITNIFKGYHELDIDLDFFESRQYTGKINFVMTKHLWGKSVVFPTTKYPADWLEFLKEMLGWSVCDIRYKCIDVNIDIVINKNNSKFYGNVIVVLDDGVTLPVPFECIKLGYLYYRDWGDIPDLRQYDDTFLEAAAKKMMTLADSLGNESVNPVKIKYHTGWWQAFKSRWFPDALLVHFPVEYIESTIDRDCAVELFSDIIKYSQLEINGFGDYHFVINKKERTGFGNKYE